MTTGFHEVSFPSRLAYGASGGPKTRVDITQLASGFEKRNARWSQPLRRYTVDVGQRPIAEIRELIAFFESRGGPLNGFRFKDPVDFSTAVSSNGITAQDVEIGEGDGVTKTFQLNLANGRIIHKPIASSIVVALAGSIQNIDFNLDEATGLLTFEAPPVAGAIISAGFEYEIPVRFENEEIVSAVTARNAAQVSDISLVEVRV